MLTLYLTPSSVIIIILLRSSNSKPTQVFKLMYVGPCIVVIFEE